MITSLELFTGTDGTLAAPTSFVSIAEERWFGCISAKAVLQQNAIKKKMRAIRTIANMIERPCVRKCRSAFPIPFP
jgi:hypothetical protein